MKKRKIKLAIVSASILLFNYLQVYSFTQGYLNDPKSKQVTDNTTKKNQDHKGQKWKLTFSDNFNGNGSIDTTKWDIPEYNRKNNEKGPDGWWSKEDSYRGKGNLVIRVRKIPNKNNDSDPYDYSSGAIRTRGKFLQAYGKYEIRCKLPEKQGWWVAFWMMQGNVSSVKDEGVDGSEVDIMEAFGWGEKVNSAIHWNGYGKEHKSVGHPMNIPGIKKGFHTYTLEWYPEIYIFYVDGVETWRTTGGGVCNQPGYVKITGEISTESSATSQNWAREPSPELYPDYFLVDWVRVYRPKK
jgi:beta-glucanase (GH16 family)